MRQSAPALRAESVLEFFEFYVCLGFQNVFIDKLTDGRRAAHTAIHGVHGAFSPVMKRDADGNFTCH
jgi:hypothetical protein